MRPAGSSPCSSASASTTPTSCATCPTPRPTSRPWPAPFPAPATSPTQSAAAKDLRFAPESVKIRRELKLLLANRVKDDTVLIAFAGHGVQFAKEEESYFCPADAQLTDRKTLISLSALYRELERCPARVK